jgi:hypothetical protein
MALSVLTDDSKDSGMELQDSSGLLPLVHVFMSVCGSVHMQVHKCVGHGLED